MSPAFSTFVRLVGNLPREMAAEDRYGALLEGLRAVFPCDAVALLRLEGDVLCPLAVAGLTHDTLGRRFRLADHPRLLAMMNRRGPTRLSGDCDLPDPYDGLAEGRPEQLEIHDCMGCPLYVEDRPWGLLTLDALRPGAFDASGADVLQAFATLATATVVAVERLECLARRAEQDEQVARLLAEAQGPNGPRTLAGHSAAMRRLHDEIDAVAGTDLTVLITGETGTGKELAAQAIHARSRRAARPLITLNCAALPEHLVESELFGHVRGAFTGAVGERRGRFELADGGTLLLDEVGELPLGVQAKLLRVLQSGQLQRLGSDREHRVEVRVLAATNRDLAAEVRAGRFRADLYHRLSVYPLHVPPLRERRDDVPVLSGHFLELARERLGVGPIRMTVAARTRLLDHAWPGNVRELEHALLGGALRASEDRHGDTILIDVPHLALDGADGDATATDDASGRRLREAVDEFTKRLIVSTVTECGGNWAEAARRLGLQRGNLHRLATRLRLRGR